MSAGKQGATRLPAYDILKNCRCGYYISAATADLPLVQLAKPLQKCASSSQLSTGTPQHTSAPLYTHHMPSCYHGSSHDPRFFKFGDSPSFAVMMLCCFIIAYVSIWSGLLAQQSLCLPVGTCFIHYFYHACAFGALTDHFHSFRLQSTPPGTILGPCHMADHDMQFVMA